MRSAASTKGRGDHARRGTANANARRLWRQREPRSSLVHQRDERIRADGTLWLAASFRGAVDGLPRPRESPIRSPQEAHLIARETLLHQASRAPEQLPKDPRYALAAAHGRWIGAPVDAEHRGIAGEARRHAARLLVAASGQARIAVRAVDGRRVAASDARVAPVDRADEPVVAVDVSRLAAGTSIGVDRLAGGRGRTHVRVVRDTVAVEVVGIVLDLVDERHAGHVVGAQGGAPAVEVREEVHRGIAKDRVRLVRILRGMAEPDRVTDLVGHDLLVVLAAREAVREAVVDGQIAFGDASEGLPVEDAGGPLRAEAADRENAGAVAERTDLARGIVGLHDAPAVAHAAGDRG